MIQDLEKIEIEERMEVVEEVPVMHMGEEQPPKRVNFFDVLRNANFRRLWLGQVVSQVGDYFAFLALTVVVSSLSPDEQSTTLAVSGMMLSFSLPRLLFGLLAGVFVDRWDRRQTMLVSDVLRMGLALMMIPGLLLGNIWVLYGLAFLMSTVGTLFNPAKGALIPKLVPADHLLAANSLSQSSQMLAMLAGPALAGLTLTLAGAGREWIAFVVDGGSYFLSAILIWLIRVAPADRRAPAQAGDTSTLGSTSAIGKVWTELKEGLRALVFSRVMGTLSAVFAITMLGVGAINVLWVVFLKSYFGYEGPELAWRLSVMDIAFGAGMLSATALAGNLFSHVSPKWYVVISLLGMGLPIALFGYVGDYWLATGVTLVMGFFVGPINTGVMTFMQIVVPNRMLGRVGGGFGTVADTASVASMSLAGLVGAAIGIPGVFALAGILCIVAGFASWVLLPPITMKDKVED